MLSSAVEYPCGKVPLQNNNSYSQKQFVGGIQCPRGHCPWQVLIDYNGESLCGAALLDDNWVITAAHCVHQKDTDRLKVITGDHDLDVMDGSEEVYNVTRVVVHENYDPVSMDSDLALLQLHEQPKRSVYTVPVCLPTPHLAENELAAIRFHMLSGWGKRTPGDNIYPTKGLKTPSSATLQRLAVPLFPTAQCEVKSGVNITANMFCAGYTEGSQDSCRGHDGSPLVTRYEGTYFLTGIMSWGKGCSQPGNYGIYTKVANFLKWLEMVKKTNTESLNISGFPSTHK